MTTATVNTAIAHTSDATFRAWAQEFHDLLIAIGLVNTSDTGQIDLTTVTRPAAGLFAGYKMYRFNDTLQGTYPIYIRMDYGTGPSAANPAMKVQVGVSTNGAGSLGTGAVTQAFTFYNNNVLIDTTTPRMSRACAGEGFAWIAFKYGALANSLGYGFMVNRTADANGNPDGLGFQLTGISTNSAFACNIQQALLAGPTLSAVTIPNCLIPGGYTSSVVDTDVQFWKHYMATPRMRCNPWMLTTNVADTPYGTERSLTVVGATARNFISVDRMLGTTCGANAVAGNTLMLPWE